MEICSYFVAYTLFLVYWLVSLVLYGREQHDFVPRSLERTTWWVLLWQFILVALSVCLLSIPFPFPDGSTPQSAISLLVASLAVGLLGWYVYIAGAGLIAFALASVLLGSESADWCLRVSVRIFTEGSNAVPKDRRRRRVALALLLMAITTTVIACAEALLIFEWQEMAKEFGRTAGVSAARLDYQEDAVRFLELTAAQFDKEEPSSPVRTDADGVPIWQYPWYPSLAPASRVLSEAYVRAYNGTMQRLVSAGDTAPSAANSPP